MKYATNQTGSWVTSTITGGFYTGDSGIVIDSNDKVHIAYIDSDLSYTNNVSGSWVFETIDATTTAGTPLDIAIDGNDKLYISYVDTYPTVTTNSSGSWEFYVVDDTSTNIHTALVVGSDQKIHFSYQSCDGSCIKYAKNF